MEIVYTGVHGCSDRGCMTSILDVFSRCFHVALYVRVLNIL